MWPPTTTPIEAGADVKVGIGRGVSVPLESRWSGGCSANSDR